MLLLTAPTTIPILITAFSYQGSDTKRTSWCVLYLQGPSNGSKVVVYIAAYLAIVLAHL